MEAMWSALVLIGRHDGYNIPLLDDVRRLKLDGEPNEVNFVEYLRIAIN
jgi:hypothetical protein